MSAMGRSLRSSIVGSTAAALLVAVFAGGSGAAPDATGSDVNRDLARVRQATVHLRTVEAAERAGYVHASECVEVPGLGAMGFHSLNPVLASDSVVDLEHPEILLFASSGGGLRLVGVEYFKADADQNLATDDDRPTLFGRGFDGPMEGHEPDMPIHYDLHVWVWEGNPDGVFAQFNPSLSCS